MRRRVGGPSLSASPVLVGAVTLLVTIVAVFLSYNANAGLPFVPTYDLRAELPNAVNLVKATRCASAVPGWERSSRSRPCRTPTARPPLA